MDEYRTIRGPTSVKLVRKGSRFIALAHPVGSAEEAARLLKEIRARYHDATHHCYAYRVVTDDGIAASSADGGEPARSAGLPILRAIEARGLLNTLVVVVRYFGGTKLGLGGLIRAYGDAAREALAQAEVMTEVRKARLALRYPLELTGEVMCLVNQYRAEIEEQDYREGQRLVVSLPASLIAELRHALSEATSGRVEFL
ncbi:MAG: IMPACT family protein [Candidatus Acetothermia bacterium]|jgi:uncharacterized YigZ family protein|nr:IMPACT family protein [Candidatus Acetothermia bacterium]MDH7505789.1 YigZ family protein [Candidatus Acetothermia bacterium]